MRLIRLSIDFKWRVLEPISSPVVLLFYKKLDTDHLKKVAIRAFSWISSCKTLKNGVLAVDFMIYLR